MVTLKNPDQIAKARIGGKILAKVLQAVVKEIKTGVGTQELDALAEKLITQQGGRPSFKNYPGTKSKFPSSLCICINTEIVHCPAVPNRIIHNGDIVSIDVGMERGGMYTDTSITVSVGKISSEAKKLLQVTKKALEFGMAQVKPGALLQNISQAIQRQVESNGFNVVRDLVGHGVGFAVHEEPHIPNYVEPRQKKVVLQEGMMLAIEPMVCAGDWHIKTLSDGWTAVTADGSLSAHFEHTVVVTKDGYEILTRV